MPVSFQIMKSLIKLFRHPVEVLNFLNWVGLVTVNKWLELSEPGFWAHQMIYFCQAASNSSSVPKPIIALFADPELQSVPVESP
jgi:hypothetical protein